MRKRLLPLLLVLSLLMGMLSSAMALDVNTLSGAITDMGRYMSQTVQSPQVGSIGGEWAVLGLARSGCSVAPQYYQDYYDSVVSYVKACKGILHEKKYTEYSRLILALTAIGKDPSNVGGYNLLTALGDFERTVWQGVNGPATALLALDSGKYPMPQNPAAKTQATRALYVQYLLDRQLPDGGWSMLPTGMSQPDITGVVLQALAGYQNQTPVHAATEKALLCMSKQQNRDGGFADMNAPNAESCVQVLVALTALGISPNDPRFVKNGKSALDNLMTFYVPNRGFVHTADGGGSNQMASEQGFYGLVAAQRLLEGKPGLYQMCDALNVPDAVDKTAGAGLIGKNSNVKAQPIVAPGKTFTDITGVYAHMNQPAIEALAARNIISGKTDAVFDPDNSMTRGEFATIVVKALGLVPKRTDNFSDVDPNAWYAPYVGAAYTYGIVSGIDVTHFDPAGLISRQESALMIARAAKLCGMDTAYTVASARDVLSQFPDYVKSAIWAREALAFCYQESLFDPASLHIFPLQNIQRGEIAQVLFNLLSRANLL